MALPRLRANCGDSGSANNDAGHKFQMQRSCHTTVQLVIAQGDGQQGSGLREEQYAMIEINATPGGIPKIDLLAEDDLAFHGGTGIKNRPQLRFFKIPGAGAKHGQRGHRQVLPGVMKGGRE